MYTNSQKIQRATTTVALLADWTQLLIFQCKQVFSVMLSSLNLQCTPLKDSNQSSTSHLHLDSEQKLTYSYPISACSNDWLSQLIDIQSPIGFLGQIVGH